MQKLIDWWTGYSKWKIELSAALGKRFDMDGAEYIRQTGDGCWREMFSDGLSPSEAAEEEAYAAASML